MTGLGKVRSDEQIERSLRRKLKKRGLKMCKKKGPVEVSDDYYNQEIFYLVIPESADPEDYCNDNAVYLTLDKLIEQVELLEEK